jgi:iron-sulfur cluster repair protein YtfE (RIC family)
VGTGDPLHRLEHAHGHLNRLVLDVAESLSSGGPKTPEAWEDLAARLDALREELLQHFADEEEALFPFVRARVPAKSDIVHRLETAHDMICGAIVRMVHLAGGEGHFASLVAVHERFESAYAGHSKEELELFEELGRVLDVEQRSELATLLRGL